MISPSNLRSHGCSDRFLSGDDNMMNLEGKALGDETPAGEAPGTRGKSDASSTSWARTQLIIALYAATSVATLGA